MTSAHDEAEGCNRTPVSTSNPSSSVHSGSSPCSGRDTSTSPTTQQSTPPCDAVEVNSQPPSPIKTPPPPPKSYSKNTDVIANGACKSPSPSTTDDRAPGEGTVPALKETSPRTRPTATHVTPSLPSKTTCDRGISRLDVIRSSLRDLQARSFTAPTQAVGGRRSEFPVNPKFPQIFPEDVAACWCLRTPVVEYLDDDEEMSDREERSQLRDTDDRPGLSQQSSPTHSAEMDLIVGQLSTFRLQSERRDALAETCEQTPPPNASTLR